MGASTSIVTSNDEAILSGGEGGTLRFVIVEGDVLRGRLEGSMSQAAGSVASIGDFVVAVCSGEVAIGLTRCA